MKIFLVIICVVLSTSFGMILVDLLSTVANHPLDHLAFMVGTILGGILFVHHFISLTALIVWLSISSISKYHRVDKMNRCLKNNLVVSVLTLIATVIISVAVF